MGTSGLYVYRVDGIYYCIRVHSDGYPSGLGKHMIDQIPSSPEAFQVWKDLQVKYFQKEAILNARGVYSADQFDLEDFGVECRSPPEYGDYCTQPSAAVPTFRGWLNWMYVVDLDEGTFSFGDSSVQRKFHLDNIPRFLFEERPECDFLWFLSAPISRVHLPGSEAFPEANKVDLHIFEQCSAHTLQVPKTDNNDPNPWTALRLVLLDGFMQRNQAMFLDLLTAASRRTLNSLDPDTSQSFGLRRFRQLSYGILNICNAATGTGFKRESSAHGAAQSSHNTTDWGWDWETPDKSHYWMGDVLIVLEPRILILEYLNAAIGKAIRLIKASHLKTSPNVAVIIFSISTIAFMNIKSTGTDTEIHLSPNLSLISPEEFDTFFVSVPTNPTPGMTTLLWFFSQNTPPATSQPANLPLKTCHRIFHHSTTATQQALSASCRVFRNISREHPRIGEWDLVHPWQHQSGAFVAQRGPGLQKCVVSLTLHDAGRYTSEQLRLQHARGGAGLKLGFPSFTVAEVAEKGYDRCECCVGLPVRRGAVLRVGGSLAYDGADWEQWKGRMFAKELEV